LKSCDFDDGIIELGLGLGYWMNKQTVDVDQDDVLAKVVRLRECTPPPS
jgi:hypothetical protein